VKVTTSEKIGSQSIVVDDVVVKKNGDYGTVLVVGANDLTAQVKWSTGCVTTANMNDLFRAVTRTVIIQW
jgi:hypothetical protein